MALSAIHLFNWFNSFSPNILSLICFSTWKKKSCLKNVGQPSPTRNSIDSFDLQLDWPTNPVDSTGTRLAHFVTSICKSCLENPKNTTDAIKLQNKRSNILTYFQNIQLHKPNLDRHIKTYYNKQAKWIERFKA